MTMTIQALEDLRTDVKNYLDKGDLADFFAAVGSLPFFEGVEFHKQIFITNSISDGLYFFTQRMRVFGFDCIDREIARLRAEEQAQTRLQTHETPQEAGNEAAKWLERGKQTTDAGAKISAYSEAIALNPDFAEAYHRRALALYEMSRYQEAEADANRAILLEPNNGEAYNNRGNICYSLGKHQEAEADYRAAMKFAPDSAEACYNLAMLKYTLREYQEAETYFDKAIAIKSTYAEAYNNRGNAKYWLERYEEALADFDKAISIKSDYAEVFWNKVFVYEFQGNRQAALDSLQEAIRLNPQYKEYAQTEPDFDELRKDKAGKELLK